MSYNGLVQQEKQARLVCKKIETQLNAELMDLKTEIEKIRYLLGDSIQSAQWAAQQAGDDAISRLLARMSETEQLYLTAGNSRAATIFKTRTDKQLRQRLTNLQATELDLKMRLAKVKNSVQSEVLSGLTGVKREGALNEMYEQAHEAGGFLGNFGRPYLNDLVTLETKSAGSKTLGEYMSNLFKTYESGVKDAFIHGIVRGDSYELMEQHLQEATDITAGKAKILIRTEANAIFNQSVRDVIDDNPLVKGYRFRAVLDSHTSKICQQHDGQYIPKEDVQPGVNYPPLHPNCRSTVTTVLSDEDEKKDIVQRYTKNSQNQWEEVPPGMTYPQYKERFGFSNSKNPASYEVPTRSIHDTTLGVKTEPTYHGYVKASRSAPMRIRKLVDSYIDDRDATKAIIQQNGSKGLMQQALIETGFDGLPTEMTNETFDKFITDGESETYELVFKNADEKEAFLRGEMTDSYSALTKEEFAKLPEKKRQHRLTIATRSKNRIAMPGQDKSMTAIGNQRYQKMVDAGIQNDKVVGDVLKVQYGYDASKTQKGLQIFNRTSVIVRGEPVEIEIPDLNEFSSTEPQPMFTTFKEYQKEANRYKPAWRYANEVVETTVKRKKGMHAVSDIISTTEGKACKEYTGSAYEWMNKEARQYFSGEIQVEDMSDQVLNCMKGVYQSGHITKEPVVLSRGTGMREVQGFFKQLGLTIDSSDLTEEQIKQLAGKTVFIDNAVESTSFSSGAAFSGKVRMHFYVPPGGKVLAAVSDQSSYHSGEGEGLVLGGQALNVVEATYDGLTVDLYVEVVAGRYHPLLKELIRKFGW